MRIDSFHLLELFSRVSSSVEEETMERLFEMDPFTFVKFTYDSMFLFKLSLDVVTFFLLCTDLAWSDIIGVGVGVGIGLGTDFMVPFSFRATKQLKCLVVLKAMMLLAMLVALCFEPPDVMRFYGLEWGIFSSVPRFVPERNILVLAVVLLSAFVSQCLGLFELLTRMATQAEFNIQAFILATLLVYAVYIMYDWYRDNKRRDDGNIVIVDVNFDGSIEIVVVNADGSIVRTTSREE